MLVGYARVSTHKQTMDLQRILIRLSSARSIAKSTLYRSLRRTLGRRRRWLRSLAACFRRPSAFALREMRAIIRTRSLRNMASGLGRGRSATRESLPNLYLIFTSARPTGAIMGSLSLSGGNSLRRSRSLPGHGWPLSRDSIHLNRVEYLGSPLGTTTNRSCPSRLTFSPGGRFLIPLV